jgi:hypothetical protein
MKSLYLAVLILLSGCIHATEKFDADAFYGSSEIHPSSLIQLISNPNNFLNKRVTVNGYFVSAGDSWLYLTSEHATVRDILSAVNILDDTETGELNDTECNNGWVEVHGYYLAVFNKERREVQGRLIVDRMYSYAKGKHCWERKKAVPLELLK